MSAGRDGHSRRQLAPWVLGTLLVGAAPGTAQQPTFRAATVGVEVDVVAVGADGRFVDDLTLADFDLAEDGTPHVIDAISLVGREPPDEPRAAATTRSAGRRIIWIIDDLHLSPGALTRARDGLLASIRSDLRPGDVGGLVRTEAVASLHLVSNIEELAGTAARVRASSAQRGRRLVLDEWPRFTSEDEAERVVGGDRLAREAVLNRARLEEPEACARADCEGSVQEQARRIVTDADTAARQTLGVLLGVTRAVEPLPGRSTIVLVTEGFLATTVRPEIDRIARAAADSRTTIHIVDARGLDLGSQRGTTLSPDAAPVGTLATIAVDPIESGITSVAAATGGRVIRHDNRLARVFGELADTAGRRYVLVYRPQRQATTEEWRRITVRVKRPSVRAFAKQGYRAVPGAAVPAEAPAATHRNEASAPLEPLPRLLSPMFGAPAVAESGAIVRRRVDELREATVARPDPALPTERLADAWARYQRGDVEGARERLTGSAPDETPAWALYLLGLCEAALARPADAARAWETVRAAVPVFQPVYFDLADAYLAAGDSRRALDVLRAATARWPDEAEGWNALGIVLLRRSAVDDAIDAFERAVRVAPDEGLGAYNLGPALELRYERARRWRGVDFSVRVDGADLARARLAYLRAASLDGPAQPLARDALARLSRR